MMVGFQGKVTRVAQNDDVKQATTTAKTKAEADPYGMTTKRATATAMPGRAEEFIPPFVQ